MTRCKQLDVLISQNYSLFLYPTRDIAYRADELFPKFESDSEHLSQVLGMTVYKLERSTPFVLLEQWALPGGAEYLKILTERGKLGWIGPFPGSNSFWNYGIKPFGNML